MIYCLIGFVAIAAYYDLKYCKIPNVLTIAGMVGGLVYGFLQGAPPGMLSHLISLIAIFIILYPVFVTGGLGAGDAKLFMAIAAISKIRIAINILIISLFITIVTGLVKKGYLLIKEKAISRKTTIKMAPAILAGTVIKLFINII